VGGWQVQGSINITDERTPVLSSVLGVFASFFSSFSAPLRCRCKFRMFMKIHSFSTIRLVFLARCDEFRWPARSVGLRYPKNRPREDGEASGLYRKYSMILEVMRIHNPTPSLSSPSLPLYIHRPISLHTKASWHRAKEVYVA
jgi:hypothetical protein